MRTETLPLQTVRDADPARPVGYPQGAAEDWLAAILGVIVVALALCTASGYDLLGWAVTARTWTALDQALAPVSKSYAALGGVGALAVTLFAFIAVMSAGALVLKANVRRFALSFAVVFAISYACWIVGSHARLAVTTPAELAKFGLGWSLRLTNEGGYIIALVAGLVVANALPRFAAWLRDAIRPEWYIKIGIVLLGGFLAVTAAEKLSLATSLMLRGIAAIIEAYLIYWAVVYYVARRWFGFSREFAVPLASGISICGVSAAIATGSAIRARPVVPIMVSSLVVIFAVVELLVLPFIAQAFLADEPMVAGAWMGLAVKTDGAAVASGSITEALILSTAAQGGTVYEKGWILGTTTTVKVFIDVFIGIWAFILAWIWTSRIERREGDRARPIELWQRFPKFILGYVATFAVVLALALHAAPVEVARLKAAMSEANVFRGIFFVMTFFSIGAMTDVRKLWREGIGRLAAVYVVSLFGFVIWVGLVISFVFFGGVKPPLAG